MNRINILIISNTFDFTTDYICLEFKKRNVKYLRIDRDEFDKYQISLDVLKCSMKVVSDDGEFYLDEQTLKSIYYRAPIYLRDIYKPNIPVNEQLFRTQWTAFIRDLTIFEKAIWVNNPESTFRAENKMLQLKCASRIGFLCPNTVVTNTNQIDLDSEKTYIVKSLDTALLRIDDKEAFVYSNQIKGSGIKDANLKLAPVFIQDYINPKIDVRVTIIGRTVYAVRITKNGKGVQGDWRKIKNDIQFIPFSLPPDIEAKCIKLLKVLGLSFGGMDLIESHGNYYFIEVNPTGEWAWLVNTAGLPIYEGICDYLEGNNATI